MIHTKTVFLILLVLSLAKPASLRADSAECLEGYSPLEEQLLLAITSRSASNPQDRLPASSQTTAPTSGQNDTTSLVTSTGQTNLFAVAFESGLIETGDGKLTLNLNPFAFKVARDSRAWTDQSLFEASETLREFSGTLSFGGKGEKFDRDGDGKADDPLEAKSLDDIVQWEVRFQPKNRDMRESYNWERYLQSTRDQFEDWATALERLVTELEELGLEEILQEDRQFCVNKIGLRNLLARNAVWQVITEEVQTLAREEKDLDASHDEITKKIVNDFIWSVALGGIERGDDFGRDERYAAFRGDRGIGAGKKLTFEAKWTEVESRTAGEPDPEVLKLGLEWSTLLLRGSDGLAEGSREKTSGIELSWAGSWEQFNDVPDAKHDTIGKLGVKLELPLAGAMKLPISVTWANHVDLLTDEDEVVGHIGISWDLSKVMSVMPQ